jgi:hypothetical protein
MRSGSSKRAEQRPFPRRKLGPGILTLLWILRIYVLIAVPLVVYAFVRALHQTP